MKNKLKVWLSTLMALCMVGTTTACDALNGLFPKDSESVADSSVESSVDETPDSSEDPVTSEDPDSVEDSSVEDSSVEDSSVVDSSTVDSSVVDSSTVDSSVEDSSVEDSSMQDSTSEDSSVEDSSSESGSSGDSSSEDSSVEDSSSEDPGTPEVPEDGAMLTIPEVSALDIEAAAGNKYYVEGTVISYSDTYKGGLYIQDAEGNELCIYGLQKVYPADEYSEGYVETFNEMWYENKPQVGATVKFYGEVGAYNNVNQFVDAEFEILSQPAEDPEAHLPEDGMTLTIEEVLALEVTSDTLRQYYVEGTVKEIKSTKYGNMYIEDANGNSLYIYGLYDMWTGARYDSMEDQPQVGEIVSVKSSLSYYNGIQLKNARLCECRPAPIELNLNGETVIDIAAGDAENWEYVYVNAAAPADAEQYVITWDASVTNLMVNYGMVQNGGILTAYDGVVEVSFYADDFAALTVTVTLTPYIAPPTPEFVLGENAIEVTGLDGTAVQVSTAGEYVLSLAEGETNAYVVIETDFGSEMIEFPYTFTVAEDEAITFIVMTNDWSADEVNLVLTEGGAEVEPTLYTVTFVDYDGTVLSTATYEAGAAVVEPAEPAREDDETYWYAFAGWDNEVTAVAGDVTYTAVYEATYIDYTITFLTEDGTIIVEELYHYGDTVNVPAGPDKPADETYTYAFAGWSPEVVAVAGHATYTATYTATYIDYTVTYLNDDGTILSQKIYHYGEDVSVPVAEKADSAVYSYTFEYWEIVEEPDAYNTTYKAVYSATLKDGYSVNNTEASVGESVVLGAGSIGAGANYIIGQNAGGSITQAYLVFEGDYNFDDYVVFDFTGKNMPEVMFFAENYDASMYYSEGKQGITVASGITLWDGSIGSAQTNNTKVGVSGPFGAYYEGAAAPRGGNMLGDFAAQLARANLVDGTQYRIIMGITKASSTTFSLKYMLYNVTDGVVVEEVTQTSWAFFTGSNDAVNNMTLDDLSGSIVLYGKFNATCTIDKVWGVYQDTDIASIANGINNNATYTVTFKDADGNVLQTVENVAFGETVSCDDVESAPPADDALFTYSYVWDKAFGPITKDTEYQLTLQATPKDGVNANNTTVQDGKVVLGSGGIGDGANYTMGQNNGGYVNQAYLGFDGGYGLDNYIVFDFTGKNLPEIAFFANNYNDSMYADGTSKQGIVVVTGITTWNGGLDSGVNGNGTQINYGHPYMIQDAASGAFCQSAMKSSALGRANLVDGTHYRVIMGFTGSGSAITLNWCLYNLDTNEVVEQSSMTTWNFFTGSNSDVGNMTINDLNGSIVLYGKFGATCTIDALHGVQSGDFATVVENAKAL